MAVLSIKKVSHELGKDVFGQLFQFGQVAFSTYLPGTLRGYTLVVRPNWNN
jgi:hypothetical protein